MWTRRRRRQQRRGAGLRRQGRLVLLALASASWGSIAASAGGEIEILKRGVEPESLIRFRPVAGATQRLAWEWTAEPLSIRGSIHSSTVAPAGEKRSARGLLDASFVAVEEDGFSCRRSLSVGDAEPPDDAWSSGFRETVVKDLRGLTRSIDSGGSLVKAPGMVSPWTVHRALDLVFPDQPVGTDAQWRVARSLELDAGLTLEVEAIYELKQIAADSVGIVYTLDVKRAPAPSKYARQVQALGASDPSTRARNRLYVSLSCNGRAFQGLQGSLPGQAELVCRVMREWRRGNSWITSPAAGEHFTVRVGPPGG